jgi:hypothetical protein
MANSTDFTNLPETLTVDTRDYSNLYYIGLKAIGMLEMLEREKVEIPAFITEHYADEIREVWAEVK